MNQAPMPAVATPPRVVHVTEVDGGGVLIWLVDVCGELERLGWQQTLVRASGPGSEDGVARPHGLSSGVQLASADLKRTVQPFHVWRSARQLAEYFKRVEPDIVHLHSSIAGGIGRLAARRAGFSDRVIYSPHGLAFLRRDVPWFTRKMFWLWEWIGARLGGSGVACSKGEYDAMLRFFRADRLYLLENAVQAYAIPAHTDSSEAIPLVGCSGRLAAQKAPEEFSRVAAAIPRDRAEFMWIGGGDEDKTTVLTNAAVDVTGWLSRPEAVQRVCDLDIYLSTSLWEGMPLALIEAQVAGIPAVVSDVVGNRDIVIHGKTGYIGTNTEEMAVYVERLVRDRGLRLRLGRQAREMALERFDITRLVDSLDALYRRIANIEAG